jgi:uncharacterized membrane-anchored protein
MFKENIVEYKKLFLGLGVLFLLIFIYVFYSSYPLIIGEKVLLRTMPYDPFHPIYGQYLKINYEISSIPNSFDYKNGDKIYVLLEKEKDSNYWVYSSSSKTRPNEGFFIKGKVIYNFNDEVNVIYGIERYYIQRNAEIIDEFDVMVKVASNGKANIYQLLKKGTNNKIQIEYR